MEICIYLKAYLHKIWWHLNFNFNFEIYFRKLFNEEAFIQGRSRSQNNFIDTSGVIFLCIANEKYFQFETQQRICLLAIVNWTYCFSILYSPEYQFQFPHSQIHLYCIELCLREEAVVQVLHRGAVSVATITIYILYIIHIIWIIYTRMGNLSSISLVHDPESNGPHLKTKHVLEYRSKLLMNPSFFIHIYLKLKCKSEILMVFVK